MPKSVSWPSGMYLVTASALRMSGRMTMASVCHCLAMVRVYVVSVERKERLGSCSTKTNVRRREAQTFNRTAPLRTGHRINISQILPSEGME